MNRIILILTIILSGCTYEPYEPADIKIKGPMMGLNYNIPSHDYKQIYQPIVDFANIIKDFDYETRTHTNTSLSIADFNNDGYGDLYFHNNYSGKDSQPVDPIFMVYDPIILSYTKNIDFDFVNNIETVHSRKAITGDFNLDGKPDVVRVAGAHDFLYKSNITLSSKDGYELTNLTEVPKSQYHTLSSGDIDRDGDLDIFFGGTYEDGFGINNGNGTFSWVRSYEVIDNYKVPNSPDGDHGINGAWSSEITDMNNDGYLDIVLAGSYGDTGNDLDGVTIILGGLNGYDYKDRIVITMDPAIAATTDIALVDYNKDGIKDIVTKSGTLDGYYIISAFGSIDGQLSYNEIEVEDSKFNNLKGLVWIVVRDVDKDGKIEIVEQEKSIYEYTDNIRKSVEWEFSGKKFVK